MESVGQSTGSGSRSHTWYFDSRLFYGMISRGCLPLVYIFKKSILFQKKIDEQLPFQSGVCKARNSIPGPCWRHMQLLGGVDSILRKAAFPPIAVVSEKRTEPLSFLPKIITWFTCPSNRVFEYSSHCYGLRNSLMSCDREQLSINCWTNKGIWIPNQCKKSGVVQSAPWGTPWTWIYGDQKWAYVFLSPNQIVTIYLRVWISKVCQPSTGLQNQGIFLWGYRQNQNCL